jgi:hypothetical protein
MDRYSSPSIKKLLRRLTVLSLTTTPVLINDPPSTKPVSGYIIANPALAANDLWIWLMRADETAPTASTIPDYIVAPKNTKEVGLVEGILVYWAASAGTIANPIAREVLQ